MNIPLPDIDEIDRRILDVLQQNARISNHELAQKVGLSASPCWRRMRRLEKMGVIRGYATVLDAARLGLPVTAIAMVTLDDHHPDTVATFDEAVNRLPEILDCMAISGEHDYLLRILAPGMDSYQRFLADHLLQVPGIRSVNTVFALKHNKQTTAIPL